MHRFLARVRWGATHLVERALGLRSRNVQSAAHNPTQGAYAHSTLAMFEAPTVVLRLPSLVLWVGCTHDAGLASGFDGTVACADIWYAGDDAVLGVGTWPSLVVPMNGAGRASLPSVNLLRACCCHIAAARDRNTQLTNVCVHSVAGSGRAVAMAIAIAHTLTARTHDALDLDGWLLRVRATRPSTNVTSRLYAQLAALFVTVPSLPRVMTTDAQPPRDNPRGTMP